MRSFAVLACTLALGAAMQIQIFDGDLTCTTETANVAANVNTYCNEISSTTSIRWSCADATSSATTTMESWTSNGGCPASTAADNTWSSTSGTCFDTGAASYRITCDISPPSSCFSPESTVVLESGAVVPYSSLAVGDRVLSVTQDGAPFFDKVFRITHHSPNTVTEFVRLTTESDHVLEMSPSHYIHAGELDVSTLALANDLSVGDTVFVVSSPSTTAVSSKIVSLERVTRVGAFNVHTLNSNIVVDGVVATHFSSQTTWGPSTREYAPLWYKLVDMKNAVTGAEDASESAMPNLRN